VHEGEQARQVHRAEYHGRPAPAGSTSAPG
jgi:hypothetical protein